MRRLLQRIEDGLYYQGRGAWTEDPENALVFDKTAGAIECCLKEHLPQVQLVLKFEDSVFDIRLPERGGSNFKSFQFSKARRRLIGADG